MRMRLVSRWLFIVAALAARADAAPRPLERIVAVVDERPIFLSELRARGRPILAKLVEDHKKPMTEPEVAAVYRELLERIIEERVFELDADTRAIQASADEIDRAVQMVAESAHVTPEDLYAEVHRFGMDRQAYREEIRRQLVDGRWTVLVLRPRVRVPAADEAAFMKALAEERAKEISRLRARHFIEVRP